ncbi:MAG: hypothetical protein ACE5JX_04100 [Acidobacteriota bacterium]
MMPARNLFPASLGLCILTLLPLQLLAEKGNIVVGKKATTTFTDPVRIGNLRLSPRTYQFQHVMDSNKDEHFVVFRRMARLSETHTSVGREAGRVKCRLVPLAGRARHTEMHFSETEENSSGERVLKELIVRGEVFKHVF